MTKGSGKRADPAPQVLLSPELEAMAAALEARPDSAIDLTDPEVPEIKEWTGFRRGRFYRPAPTVKQQVTLRIDADVLAWFRQHAPRGGYQSDINRVLREYVDERSR